MAQDLSMACVNAAAFLSIKFSMFSSSHSNNSASLINPYLIISENPDANSRSGNVSNVPLLIIFNLSK